MADLKEDLAALGRCEREIDDLLRRKSQLPQAIVAAQAGAQQARDVIAQRHQQLAEAEKTRRGKEAELRDFEARRLKFQGQSAQVKTNDEYKALLHQIDDVAQRISETEDQILIALETAEGIAGELGEVERQQREIEQRHVRDGDALHGQLGEVEKELERRQQERETLIPLLPRELAPRYLRVRGSTGSGTAFLVGRSCGRCHRDVPIETINRLRAGEGHVCGNCGRLLVFTESDVLAP
jgi:hypothetical protein